MITKHILYSVSNFISIVIVSVLAAAWNSSLFALGAFGGRWLRLLFRFFIFDERSKDTYFVVFVLLEIETEFLPKSQLQKIVVEGFLRNANFWCGILQRVSEQVALRVLDSIVELAPQTDLLDYVQYRSLLSLLLVRDGWCLVYSLR